MPLSIPNLRDEMKANIISIVGIEVLSEEQLTKFCQAMSKSVVDHIIANALVTSVTSTPNAQGGTTTLPGTATGTVT